MRPTVWILLAVACGSDDPESGNAPPQGHTDTGSVIESVDSAPTSDTGSSADTASATGPTAATGATADTGIDDAGLPDRYAPYVDCLAVSTVGPITIEEQYDSSGLLMQARSDVQGGTVFTIAWTMNKATGHPERAEWLQEPGSFQGYTDYDLHGWPTSDGLLSGIPGETTSYVNTYDGMGLLTQVVKTDVAIGTVTTSTNNSCEDVEQQVIDESGRTVIYDTVWTYDVGCLPTQSVTTNDTTADVTTSLFDSEGRATSIATLGGASELVQTTVWTCP